MVVAGMPWVFSVTQLDRLELPKQTLLICTAGIVWLLLLAQDLLRKEWRVAWDRATQCVLVCSVIFIGLACFSQDPYASWIGTTKQISFAAATMLAGGAWWLAIRRLVNAPLRFALVGGTWALSLGVFVVATSAWLFGHGLWPWTSSLLQGSTPVGTVADLAVCVTPLVLLALYAFIHGKQAFHLSGTSANVVIRVLALILFLPSVLLIGITASPVPWLALAGGSLVLYGATPKQSLKRIWQWCAGVFLLFALLIGLFPQWNPWRSIERSVSQTASAEVTLSTPVSWSMAIQGLKKDPFVGQGAGTWISLFLQERDPGLNLSPLARVRFYQGSSALATVAGTLGIVGLLAWAAWLLLPWFSVLFRTQGSSPLHFFRTPTLALCVVMAFLWAGLTFTVTSVFFVWLLSALFYTTETTELTEIRVRFDRPFRGVLPIGFLVVGIFFCSWGGFQRYFAEWMFVLGKQAYAQHDLINAERRVTLARVWNRWNDVYPSFLSQVHAAQARDQLAQSGNDVDLTYVSSIVSKAERLNQEARALAPHRVDNWISAAYVASLRDSLVAPTLRGDRDLRALAEAERLDPSNADIALLIAGRYLDRVEQSMAMNATTTSSTADQALHWFNQAAALHAEPDQIYNGLARLALAQRQVNEAIAALEALRQYGDQDQLIQTRLALLYLEKGNDELGLRLLELSVKEETSQSPPLARWSLAHLYESSGRFQEALDTLAPLLEKYPDEPGLQSYAETLQAYAKPVTIPPRP